jgi:acyl-coenzyme A thioesterase 13
MDPKAMLETGFHHSLHGLDVFEINRGRVRAHLAVNESLMNFFGKLHGGAVATLVDDVGTLAVVTADHFRRAGLTTDLQISYLTPAELGDPLLIEADTLQCGLTLAFVEVTLRHELRKRLIARGRMTKLLGNTNASTLGAPKRKTK